MSVYSIGLPPDGGDDGDGYNVKVVRELAREQGLLLYKARNCDDLWDLRDLEKKKIVLSHQPLFFVHDFLCRNLE